MISSGRCQYKPVGDDCVILIRIEYICYDLVIPTVIFDRKGKRYKVVGIELPNYRNSECATTISFDEASEITSLPVCFIECCKSVFILPPNLKRVLSRVSDWRVTERNHVILYNEKNRFVSVINRRNIVNHHPLELLCQHVCRPTLFIRETVQIVGNASFRQEIHLVSVVFPASVKLIGSYTFSGCKNLKLIKFKRNSKLKIIDFRAFEATSIVQVTFPPILREIGNDAFYRCRELVPASFSKVIIPILLKSIGHNKTGLELLEDRMKMVSFKECKKLVISFR